MHKLILHVDVFFCGMARRCINANAVLADKLEHDFCDEWVFQSWDWNDCPNLKSAIDEYFEEYEIPADEYEVTII